MTLRFRPLVAEESEALATVARRRQLPAEAVEAVEAVAFSTQQNFTTCVMKLPGGLVVGTAKRNNDDKPRRLMGDRLALVRAFENGVRG